ncbi:MAG TPA: hypothetical protein VFF65_03860, partial [Phycisphaerales bacterium]|nr:hypothetical protein [Phycisphaerales bacterium]
MMTATPTGRIGIGDAAPGAALSVVGGSESVAALEVFGSGGADIQLRSGPPTDTVGAGAFLIEGGDGSSIASAATGRSGGTVNILAGTGSAGTATNGRGGGVVLTSGRGRGSPVSAVAGAAGGVANMIAGAGGDSSTIGGDGGEVVIEGGAGGNGGSQDGEGGGIFLFAGAGSPEGNVYLDGGFVKSQSPLGVNVDPVRALHVQPAVNGSGGAPSSNTHFVFEHNSTAYIGVLTPDASEKGIAFGSPASAVHGGVYYSNAGGMSLRTGGNNTGVVIDSAGNVGVGVDPAGTRFHVRGTSPVRMVLSPSASDTNTELLFSENTTLSNGIKLQMDGSSNALSVTDVTGGAESNIAAFDRDGNAFSAGVKAFRIDHPLDPMNRELWHSCVESPDMLNVYSGNVTTGGDGLATVELPPYFSALNRDFRYQLTVIDEGDEPEVFVWAKVIRKVADNRFTVRTSRPGVEVSWQVTGVRKDALAEKHRLVVERDKPAERKGTYLHPEAFEKNGGER